MPTPTDLLANLKANKEASPEGEEKVFNVYKSTMQSHKIIRDDGKIIHVLNHQYITSDPADIEFLDTEIKAGFPYLSPAEQLTSTDLDPMSALKAKMKEEARQEILAETADSESKQAKLAPASTSTLASLSAGSNSAPAK